MTTIVSFSLAAVAHNNKKKLEDEEKKMCVYVCVCGGGGGGGKGRYNRRKGKLGRWQRKKKGGGGGEADDSNSCTNIGVEFLDCSQTRPSGWPRHLFSKTGLEGIHLYLYLLIIHVSGSRSQHLLDLKHCMQTLPRQSVTNLGLGADFYSVCLEIIPEVRVLRLQLPE